MCSGKEYDKNSNIKVAAVVQNAVNKNLNSLERDCIFYKLTV
jgi:hypothetical protein